jgi:hypothetical protein
VGAFVIIWGIRRYVQQLAILMALCPAQGHEAPHRLIRRRTKFTLFFVPLFPVSSSHQLVCTTCGNVAKIDKVGVAEVTAEATRQQQEQLGATTGSQQFAPPAPDVATG